MSNTPHKSDTSAAFLGLIGGAIFIGAVIYGMVLFTNKKFEGHSATETSAIVTTTSINA